MVWIFSHTFGSIHSLCSIHFYFGFEKCERSSYNEFWDIDNESYCTISIQGNILFHVIKEIIRVRQNQGVEYGAREAKYKIQSQIKLALGITN